jgi:hypothetical protein
MGGLSEPASVTGTASVPRASSAPSLPGPAQPGLTSVSTEPANLVQDQAPDSVNPPGQASVQPQFQALALLQPQSVSPPLTRYGEDSDTGASRDDATVTADPAAGPAAESVAARQLRLVRQLYNHPDEPARSLSIVG